MASLDTFGLLSLIAGGANAGISSEKAAQAAAALKLQLAQIPVQGRLAGQAYTADQHLAGNKYTADGRLIGTEYGADSRAGTATDKLRYDITDAVGKGEMAPEDGMNLLAHFRQQAGRTSQPAESAAPSTNTMPVTAPQSFWNYKAPGVTALATNVGGSAPDSGTAPLAGLRLGPKAAAGIGATQAKTNTAGDKSDVNFENTVGLLPANQQPTFVQQWNARNGTQYVVPGAPVGTEAHPMLGPGPVVDGKPTDLPDAQLPILAPAYQPNGLQASTIDLHGAQAGVDRARVPLITSQTDLTRVKVHDTPYLDRSTIALHNAQGQALTTNAGTNAYRAQVYGDTQPIIAGAAATRAQTGVGELTLKQQLTGAKPGGATVDQIGKIDKEIARMAKPAKGNLIMPGMAPKDASKEGQEYYQHLLHQKRLLQQSSASGNGFGGSSPNTAAAGRALGQMFGVSDIGGRASSGHTQDSDHYTGHALDFMVGNDTAKGQQLAAYAQQHAGDMGVKYIIYRQHIFNPTRASEGWRLMPDRGSPTENHMDHVHISFNNEGGAHHSHFQNRDDKTKRFASGSISKLPTKQLLARLASKVK